MSPRRNTRPFASTGVSATALAPSSAPVTRRATRCDEVSTTPAGATAFCLASEFEQRLRRDAERCELRMREFDVDLLVLHAVEVDLDDVRNLQRLLAQRVGDLLQLRVVRAVAGQHVEDRIDVAVFVVDDRADHALRQLALHVDELLAGQIEQVRHVLRRRRILEEDLHRREAGLAVGLHALEIRQLLQLLFHRLGDLALHLLRGRAGPEDRDDGKLDGEGRIFRAAEPLIGEQAGERQRDDEKQHQRLMMNRPVRQVKAAHGASPLVV